jgi:hypothetical protein
MFQYVIGDSNLERVDVINDFCVLVDNRITFVDHIELIVSKSARILGFIKRNSITLTHTRRSLIIIIM